MDVGFVFLVTKLLKNQNSYNKKFAISIFTVKGVKNHSNV